MIHNLSDRLIFWEYYRLFLYSRIVQSMDIGTYLGLLHQLSRVKLYGESSSGFIIAILASSSERLDNLTVLNILSA